MEALINIVTSTFGYGFSFFSRIYGYVTSSQDYMNTLAREMSELRSRRDDVRREVMKAQREGLEPTSQVQNWLQMVDELEAKATEMDNEYQEMLRREGSASAGWSSSYQFSRRAEEMLELARDLSNKGFLCKVADNLAPARFAELPSAPMVGAEAVVDQLRRLVGDDEVGIIGIYGMAGVGKTAILSKFNNEFLAGSTDLDLIVYIEVSKDYSIDKIQRDIGERLGMSLQEQSARKERATILFKLLSGMKFVIFLDDLWEPLNLHTVGIPIPKRQSRSKIILTTRLELVCDQMDADEKIKVDCLSWDHAWQLFSEKSKLELMESNSAIRRHAEVLARKCGGLPVALITIAHAMASKKTPGEWQHATTILNDAPLQIPRMNHNVLALLKSSYDNLANDDLRQCFLYFTLYPENCPFYNELLIEYWIGEGFIDEFGSWEEAENEATYLIGTLSASSLVESVEDKGYTKMHPMVRTMASWIAGDCGRQENKWLVRANTGGTEAPEAEKWRGAERISLIQNNIRTLPACPECPNLVSLMLKNNASLRRLPEGFFTHMPCLRVLDLGFTLLEELPVGIGNLKGLQYLNLRSTKITSLPVELCCLANLRYLGLGSTFHIKTIPEGVLASLSELRVLRMLDSYRDWRVHSSDTGVDFKELEHLKRLKILEITVASADALQRLSVSPLQATSVDLQIRCWRGMKTIPLPSTVLSSMKGLHCLRIDGSSSGLEEVLIGGGDERRSDLPSLKKLVFEQLNKAKIIWTTNGCFQNLDTLCFFYCHGMEQLIYLNDKISENEDDGHFTPFPHLRELFLNSLPMLKRITDAKRMLALPSLEVLKVRKCPQLKRLALFAWNLRELQCEERWWDELEWDDDETKATFEPLLKPLQMGSNLLLQDTGKSFSK